MLEQYHWSPERQTIVAPSIVPPFNTVVFVKGLSGQTRRALVSHKSRKRSDMIIAAKKSLGKKAEDLSDDQIVAIVKKSW